ncbi:MAG TPA: hypothetical protein VGH23_16140 [Rhizomicrobium sp.]|jgi:hypothetical protein
MDYLIAPYTVAIGSGDTAPVSGTPGEATDGNPATNTPATEWPAYAFNAIQKELINLLAAGGVTPNRSVLTQVATAVQALAAAGAGSYAADTGAANAYVIAPAPAIAAYAGGQTFNFIPANANTGAGTINVNGLGAKSIVHPDGSVLQSGDIPAGGLVEVIYQATLGKFILMTNASSYYSFGGSGNFRIPGTKAFMQWATFSINATGTTIVPAGCVWGSQSITFPISAPPNNQLYMYGFGINEAVNGPFATATATMGSGSGTIYVTTDSSYTQPVTGIVWQIVS